MSRILVLSASTYGHTGKIAGRIAEAIGPDAEPHDIESRDALERTGWQLTIARAGLVPVAAP
jgi:flavodoxin